MGPPQSSLHKDEQFLLGSSSIHPPANDLAMHNMEVPARHHGG